MAVVVVLLLVVVALVQGEVGSKNNADVELRLCEGVCDMKRLAWNCVFQLKDKHFSSSSASAVIT